MREPLDFDFSFSAILITVCLLLFANDILLWNVPVEDAWEVWDGPTMYMAGMFVCTLKNFIRWLKGEKQK